MWRGWEQICPYGVSQWEEPSEERPGCVAGWLPLTEVPTCLHSAVIHGRRQSSALAATRPQLGHSVFCGGGPAECGQEEEGAVLSMVRRCVSEQVVKGLGCEHRALCVDGGWLVICLCFPVARATLMSAESSSWGCVHTCNSSTGRQKDRRVETSLCYKQDRGSDSPLHKKHKHSCLVAVQGLWSLAT